MPKPTITWIAIGAQSTPLMRSHQHQMQAALVGAGAAGMLAPTLSAVPAGLHESDAGGTTMLFRRVRDHVVHQNRTAIAIDFLIVAAGVFVGTQVSNWNSDRLEQRRAQGYLERIRANLRDDQALMESTLAYWETVIRYGEAAIGYADERRLDGGSPWRTVLAF